MKKNNLYIYSEQPATVFQIEKTIHQMTNGPNLASSFDKIAKPKIVPIVQLKPGEKLSPLKLSAQKSTSARNRQDWNNMIKPFFTHMNLNFSEKYS
mgnify:CR=1 FL=1